jgi:glycerophosphoryl diester phosphodiesterase
MRPIMARWVLLQALLFAAGVNAQSGLAGHWTFDNAANHLAATVGNDLRLVGTDSLVRATGDNNSAVSIGPGSYYVCKHGIAPSSGSRVNEYTLVMDVRIPASGAMHALFQTNPANSDDADCFITNYNAIGVGSTGYSVIGGYPFIFTGLWYRVTEVVVGGSRADYYVNGVVARRGTAVAANGRLSLDTTVLFFADNNGEDNTIEVADIKLFSRALSDGEVATMGKAAPYCRYKPFKAMAHRTSNTCGAPGNSLAGIRCALETDSTDYLECDLNLTKDSVAVLIHNATIDGLTNGTGTVANMTLAEIQQYYLSGSTAFPNEKIPTLAQALTAIKTYGNGRGRMELDIKVDSDAMARAILRAMNEAGASADLFWPWANGTPWVRYGIIPGAHYLLPGMPSSWNDSYFANLKAHNVDAFDVYADTAGVTSQFIQDAQRNGMMVSVYTVSDEAGIRRWIQAGLDFMETDRARMLRSIDQDGPLDSAHCWQGLVTAIADSRASGQQPRIGPDHHARMADASANGSAIVAVYDLRGRVVAKSRPAGAGIAQGVSRTGMAIVAMKNGGQTAVRRAVGF